jgi:hypothetical protein
VDGTGLESRHTSRYFFKRAGRKHTSRLWTKLTVAVDTDSHFLAGATVTAGPANDSPQFQPVMAQASLVVTWDRVLADAAFDSESHHRYCREDLRVRATVIPLNRRGQGRKWPRTKFRRQMVQRFRKKPRGSRHKRVFGQRWQAESAFSRHKRRLGSALGGRSDVSYRISLIRYRSSRLAQWNPTTDRTTAGFLARYASRARRIDRSRSIRPIDRFAAASRTSGHSGSTGRNSGVHGGSRCSTTFPGTTNRLATCHPARSTSTTSTFPPPGSAWAANAANASPIRSAFTRGRRTANVSPVRGRANP